MFKREKDEFRFEPIKTDTLVGLMGGNIQQGGGKVKLEPRELSGIEKRMQKCLREGRKKATRLDGFTRTRGRGDGEEGQGQILRKNLYLELGEEEMEETWE